MTRKYATDEIYFQAVGKLMLYASQTDRQLYFSFKILTGLDFPVARAIFYTLDSLPARKTLLHRVTQTIDILPVEMGFLNEVIRAAEVANNSRKEVAHALLVRKHDDPVPKKYRLNEKNIGQDSKPVTVAWLNGLLKTAEKATVNSLNASMSLATHFLQRQKERP